MISRFEGVKAIYNEVGVRWAGWRKHVNMDIYFNVSRISLPGDHRGTLLA